MMRNEILQGDVCDVLRRLPAGRFHCCVTSPPYWNLRNYSLPPTDWPPVTFTPAAGLSPLTIPAMSCCLGLEPEPWAFVGHLVMVFREVKRVLRDDGVAWVNLGDSYNSNASNQQDGQVDRPSSQGRFRDMGRYNKQIDILKPKDLCGLPWMVAKALQADGWWLRSDIIWSKPNPMPESVTDRPTKAHEYLFLLAKAERYYYDAEAVREAGKEWAGQAGTFNRINGKWTDLSMPGQTHASHRDRDDRVPAGRNRRSVWTIATESYSGAHFATFPQALVEPCILAGSSARGCCPACGAPWARVVEREAPPNEVYTKTRKSDDLNVRTNVYKNKGSGQKVQDWLNNHPPTTTGWRPTCACDAGDPVPALILDPFFGSGTTGQVSIETGRAFVGIELSEEYIKLARKRLAGAQPALLAKGLE